MHLKTSLALATTLIAASAAATAVQAQGLTIVQSSSAPGTGTSIDASFTTTTAVTNAGSPAGYIDLFLPGYSLSPLGGACGGITYSVNGAAALAAASPCGIDGPNNKYFFALQPGTSLAADDDVSVNYPFGLITNPSTPGPVIITLETTDAGAVTDTFTNGVAAPVPTLTEWAMLLMGALLAGFAALTIRRRQMA